LNLDSISFLLRPEPDRPTPKIRKLGFLARKMALCPNFNNNCIVITKQMSIFAVDKMGEIKGVQAFYKLKVKGICLLDRYYDEIKTNPSYKSSYIRILSNMESVANKVLLPKTKFRPLLPKSQPKQYEFKYGDLRIYVIDYKGGKLIIDGGFKNSQDSDIKAFRSLVKTFNETLD